MQHFSVQHMLPVRNNVTEELLLCVKLAMCVATLLSASVLLELSAVAAPP